MHDDPDWPSHVDPSYWEEFLNNYHEYYDYVYNYFEGKIPYPPKPEPEDHIIIPEDPAMPLLDDTVGILILLLGGIAYLIYKFKFKKNEDFKN